MLCKRVNTTGERVVTISARILESQLREIDKLARLRVVLKDCSSMTILYPRRNKYSFHWSRRNGIVRINTAPHHPGPTYPRHVHLGSEEDVRPDDLTSLEAAPEENLRRVLGWVRKELERSDR